MVADTVTVKPVKRYDQQGTLNSFYLNVRNGEAVIKRARNYSGIDSYRTASQRRRVYQSLHIVRRDIEWG